MPLPLTSVDKLIRKTGAHRVSEGAAEELVAHLEEIAIEVAGGATKLELARKHVFAFRKKKRRARY